MTEIGRQPENTGGHHQSGNTPSKSGDFCYGDAPESAEQKRAWEEYFPIQAADEHYVARRDFTKFLGLTSLGFVVGQFWIIVQNWFRKNQGQPPWHAIARVDQLRVGDTLAFHYPGDDDDCLLICLAPDTYVAYDQKCTHLSCAVVPEIRDSAGGGGHLQCPCHNGQFDLATGRPIAGPPRRPLIRISLQIVEGVVYATAAEARSI